MKGARDLIYKRVGGVCIDWWWYLDICIDLFVHGDIVYPLQVGLCWLRGAPGVLQCWVSSVAGGSKRDLVPPSLTLTLMIILYCIIWFL